MSRQGHQRSARVGPARWPCGPAWRCARPKICIYKWINNYRHFRSGPNFRYYYYSVRWQSFSLLFSFRSSNYNRFRYRSRELRPFIIVLVIIIVNEKITAGDERSYKGTPGLEW